MRQFHSFLSIFLAATLTLPPLTAQTTLPPSDTVLQVRLQESDNATLPVNSTSSKGYTVQVLDATGAPVVGAAVALRLPDEGPSGTFSDGNKASVAYTDSKGVVRFQHIHWNGSAGTALVRVTVVKGAVHAGALIQQSLVVIPNGTALASAKPANVPGAPAPGAAPGGTVVAPFGPPASPATATSTSPAPPPGTQTVAAASAPPPVPGTPVSPATTVSHSGATSAALQPPSSQTASAASPSVSVTDTSSTGGTAAHTGVSKKWILLAVVAAGAGVGAALAMSGHGSSSAPAAAGLTIGSPTLSVGH
jgi:hypothetical protein